MRGKSIDTEFVAAFIQECTTNNKLSPEAICEEALHRIEEIDKQLKMRLKLVDVLSFFNYKKRAPVIESEPVSFESINKPAASEILGIIVNNGCINTDQLFSRFSNYNDGQRKDMIFVLKQMLEAKILFRNSTGILAFGPNYRVFNDYMNAGLDRIYESK
jgi:hypothetical protein